MYLQNATRHHRSENGVANYGHYWTGKLNLVYFGPQMAKNRTGVLSHPSAVVQRTGINNSVAFAKWQQQAAIKLGIAMHSSDVVWNTGPSLSECLLQLFYSFSSLSTECYSSICLEILLSAFPCIH